MSQWRLAGLAHCRNIRKFFEKLGERWPSIPMTKILMSRHFLVIVVPVIGKSSWQARASRVTYVAVSQFSYTLLHLDWGGWLEIQDCVELRKLEQLSSSLTSKPILFLSISLGNLLNIIRERMLRKEISITYHQPAVLCLLKWMYHHVLHGIMPNVGSSSMRVEAQRDDPFLDHRLSESFYNSCISMIARRWFSVLFVTNTPIIVSAVFNFAKSRTF